VAKVPPLFAPLAFIKLVQFFTVLQLEASSQRKFFELGPPASLDLALKSPAGRPPVNPPLKNRPRETPLFGPKYRVSSPNGATFFRAKFFSKVTPFEIFGGLPLSFAPPARSPGRRGVLPLRGDRAKASEASARSRRQGQIQRQKGASWRKIPLAGGRRPAGQAVGRVKALPRGELTSPSLQFGSGAPPQKAGLSSPGLLPAFRPCEARIAPAAGPTSQNPNSCPHTNASRHLGPL